MCDTHAVLCFILLFCHSRKAHENHAWRDNMIHSVKNKSFTWEFVTKKLCFTAKFISTVIILSSENMVLLIFFLLAKKGECAQCWKITQKVSFLFSSYNMTFQIIIHMIFKLILCILIIMRQFWEFLNIVDYYGIFYLAERRKKAHE